MKTLFRSATGFAGGIFTLLTAFTAFGSGNGFYVKGDLGGVWTDDTDLKEFFGPVAPGSEVKFDTFMRYGIAGGYRVTDWFSVEFETGITGNKISSITGASQVDAWLTRVPTLANARLELPNKSPLIPYVGAGLGGATTIINADPIVIGTTRMEGTDADVVFAWQVYAGLRYKINKHMDVGVEYHFLATGEPEWEASVSAGTPSNEMRFGKIESHSVSASFTYRF